jgi:hypothetical protein
MLATWVFNAMSSCCLDEWRLVVVELDASEEVNDDAWSSLYDSGTGNSPMGWLHTKLNPLASLLEHPLWRLVGSVEEAAAHQISGGGHSEQASHSEQATRWSMATVSTAARKQAALWR